MYGRDALSHSDTHLKAWTRLEMASKELDAGTTLGGAYQILEEAQSKLNQLPKEIGAHNIMAAGELANFQAFMARQRPRIGIFGQPGAGRASFLNLFCSRLISASSGTGALRPIAIVPGTTLAVSEMTLEQFLVPGENVLPVFSYVDRNPEMMHARVVEEVKRRLRPPLRPQDTGTEDEQRSLELSEQFDALFADWARIIIVIEYPYHKASTSLSFHRNDYFPTFVKLPAYNTTAPKVVHDFTRRLTSELDGIIFAYQNQTFAGSDSFCLTTLKTFLGAEPSISGSTPIFFLNTWFDYGSVWSVPTVSEKSPTSPRQAAEAAWRDRAEEVFKGLLRSCPAELQFSSFEDSKNPNFINCTNFAVSSSRDYNQFKIERNNHKVLAMKQSGGLSSASSQASSGTDESSRDTPILSKRSESPLASSTGFTDPLSASSSSAGLSNSNSSLPEMGSPLSLPGDPMKRKGSTQIWDDCTNRLLLWIYRVQQDRIQVALSEVTRTCRDFYDHMSHAVGSERQALKRMERDASLALANFQKQALETLDEVIESAKEKIALNSEDPVLIKMAQDYAMTLKTPWDTQSTASARQQVVPFMRAELQPKLHEWFIEPILQKLQHLLSSKMNEHVIEVIRAASSNELLFSALTDVINYENVGCSLYCVSGSYGSMLSSLLDGLNTIENAVGRAFAKIFASPLLAILFTGLSVASLIKSIKDRVTKIDSNWKRDFTAFLIKGLPGSFRQAGIREKAKPKIEEFKRSIEEAIAKKIKASEDNQVTFDSAHEAFRDETRLAVSSLFARAWALNDDFTHPYRPRPFISSEEIAEGGTGIIYGGMMGPVEIIAKKSKNAMTNRSFFEEAFYSCRMLLHQCPQILPLLSIFRDQQGVTYLIYERMHGHLDEAVLRMVDQAGRLSIAEQLTLAVQHIHKHGVIHRDIKMANVLYKVVGSRRAEGIEIRLCDFSIATTSSQFFSNVGTRSLNGKDDDDFDKWNADHPATHTWDIECLGRTIKEILGTYFGKLPDGTSSPMDKAGIYIDERWRILQDLAHMKAGQHTPPLPAVLEVLSALFHSRPADITENKLKPAYTEGEHGQGRTDFTIRVSTLHEQAHDYSSTSAKTKDSRRRSQRPRSSYHSLPPALASSSSPAPSVYIEMTTPFEHHEEVILQEVDDQEHMFMVPDVMTGLGEVPAPRQAIQNSTRSNRWISGKKK